MKSVLKSAHFGKALAASSLASFTVAGARVVLFVWQGSNDARSQDSGILNDLFLIGVMMGFLLILAVVAIMLGQRSLTVKISMVILLIGLMFLSWFIYTGFSVHW